MEVAHYVVIGEGGLEDGGYRGGIVYGGWVEGERHDQLGAVFVMWSVEGASDVQ